MEVPQESAFVNILGDMADAQESIIDVTRKMHSKEQACKDLKGQTHPEKGTEVSSEGEVGRGWELKQRGG